MESNGLSYYRRMDINQSNIVMLLHKLWRFSQSESLKIMRAQLMWNISAFMAGIMFNQFQPDCNQECKLKIKINSESNYKLIENIEPFCGKYASWRTILIKLCSDCSKQFNTNVKSIPYYLKWVVESKIIFFYNLEKYIPNSKNTLFRASSPSSNVKVCHRKRQFPLPQMEKYF